MSARRNSKSPQRSAADTRSFARGSCRLGRLIKCCWPFPSYTANPLLEEEPNANNARDHRHAAQH